MGDEAQGSEEEVTEIGTAAVTSLKFRYLQETKRGSGKRQRQEIWKQLGTQEKEDLFKMHDLADGEADQMFLQIGRWRSWVEEDALQRQKAEGDVNRTKASKLNDVHLLPNKKIYTKGSRDRSRGRPQKKDSRSRSRRRNRSSSKKTSQRSAAGKPLRIEGCSCSRKVLRIIIQTCSLFPLHSNLSAK